MNTDNLPTGFANLLKSFDPTNLNKMPAAELIRVFSLLKDTQEALEQYPLDEHNSSIIQRYKEWK